MARPQRTIGTVRRVEELSFPACRFHAFGVTVPVQVTSGKKRPRAATSGATVIGRGVAPMSRIAVMILANRPAIE
jgi:hypothetical protein